MMSEELYNFTWQTREDGGNRVFIQGPSDSCPIRCAYCYINGKGVEPKPYDRTKLDDTLDAIVGDENFTNHTMISLGCDTDPLLPQLLDGTIQIMSRFAARPNPIQLASKLIIPASLVEFAQDWPLGKRPPVFSTSITSIEHSAKLEPLAPSPFERAKNFDTLASMRWNSLSLMKPLLPSVEVEKDKFVDLYTRHTPDGIVVGDMYRRGLGDGTKKVHPIAGNWSLREQETYKQDMLRFLQKCLPHTFVVDSSVEAAIRLVQG